MFNYQSISGSAENRFRPNIRPYEPNYLLKDTPAERELKSPNNRLYPGHELFQNTNMRKDYVKDGSYDPTAQNVIASQGLAQAIAMYMPKGMDYVGKSGYAGCA